MTEKPLPLGPLSAMVYIVGLSESAPTLILMRHTPLWTFVSETKWPW